MPLQKLSAGLAAVFLFTFGVAVAFADSPPTTTTGATTTAPTTTAPTTTATTTTATTTAPPPTTTETTATTATTATSTAPATTATTATLPATTSAPTTTATTARATTTAATTKVKAAPAPRTPKPASQSAARPCALRAAAILRPRRPPVVLHAGGAVAYPAGGSVVRAAAVTCATRGRSEVQLRSVSLLGGDVSAALITLQAGKAAAITGLVAGGKHVSASPGARFPLGSWGYLVTGAPAGSALTIHLLRPRAGLPKGSVILVAVEHVPTLATAASAGKKARKHARSTKRLTRRPLTVTPPLGQTRFVFPVAGPADYGDSYGGFRGDVPGNWHHGDDIFAALGTPVVAVADGTINRVGWERLGGWRLWVRDSVGDQFYYAHLSGYAPRVLHSNRVEAGQVVGFIGNTGDAFTTAPHLHFEIHPRPLLHLAYDGAVDPTTYLNGWRRLQYADAPRPVHPPLPQEPLLRREARFVFRELLAARHLTARGPKATERPHVPVPAGSDEPPGAPGGPLREAAPAVVAQTASSAPIVAFLAALASVFVVAAAGLLPVLGRFRTQG